MVVSITANAQWVKKTTGVTDLLENIYFLDSLNGYACGWKGTVIKTNDGGESWTEVSTTQNLIYKDILFVDSLTGLIVGEDQFIFKTTNGGNTWVQKNTSSDLSRPIQGIAHYDKANMVAVGFRYSVISSTDTGNTWDKDSIHIIDTTSKLFNIYDVTILPGGKCIAVGDSNMVLYKDINDSIWEQMFLGNTNIPLKGVHFINDSLGYAAGGSVDIGTQSFINVFYKTTDGGKTWSTGKFINNGGTINHVQFANKDTGYVVANSGRLFRTFDGGDNWVQLLSGTPSTLYNIHLFNDTSGIVCGDGGVIIKTTNNGGYPVSASPLSTVNINIYPNPASENIYLDFGNIIVEKVMLVSTNGSVYSNLTLDKNRLNVVNLPKGIYLLTVYYRNPADNKTILSINKRIVIN